MIVNSWDECLEAGVALVVSPDKQKARSLRKAADGRINFLMKNALDEGSASYIFEGYYSSLLEYLHAMALESGYKVTSHVGLGYFILEILKKGKIYTIFDDCRQKRNSLLYYGNVMDKKTAIFAIKKIKNIMFELEKIK